MNEIHEHRAWLEATYGDLGVSRSLVELKNSILQLTDPTENSISEKISRIRSKITRLLGEDLAPYYIIEGPRSGKKLILLDRKLVTYSN